DQAAGLPRADISAILADIATKKNRGITGWGQRAAAEPTPTVAKFMPSQRQRNTLNDGPRGPETSKVSTWINKKFKNTPKLAEFENNLKALQQALDDAAPGDRPGIKRIAVEWGLDVDLAAKMVPDQLTRAIAAAYT
ncbi:unnamed protein product, partial [Effrenium voratum]